MPSRFAMTMTFIDKGDDPFTQLNGMWLAHEGSPISAIHPKRITEPLKGESLNPVSHDTL